MSEEESTERRSDGVLRGSFTEEDLSYDPVFRSRIGRIPFTEENLKEIENSDEQMTGEKEGFITIGLKRSLNKELVAVIMPLASLRRLSEFFLEGIGSEYCVPKDFALGMDLVWHESCSKTRLTKKCLEKKEVEK